MSALLSTGPSGHHYSSIPADDGRRAANAAAVLRAVLDRGAVSRSTVGQATGLSAAPRQLAEPAELGLVRGRPLRATRSSVGRPHVPVDVDTRRHVVAGIHVAVLHATLVAGLVANRMASAPRTSVTTPLDVIVAAFNAYQPEVIPGYPSMQALLAQEQLAGRLRIAPRVVAYAGEVLTPDMQARIRTAWGVEPFSMYSTTEAGMIASDCPARAGMHLWEDLALIEIVDADNRPVPAGVPGHHVLLTNLVNRAQPLVRYEITDLVTLAEGLNPTGMPFRRVTAVQGRSDDIAHLPARAGGTIPVPPHQLRAPISTTPGLRQYQIVVSPAELRVSVVLDDDAPPDTPTGIQAALHCARLDAGVEPPPITVTPVAEIPREPGHAAKFTTVQVDGCQ